jgi:hypothetical protein
MFATDIWNRKFDNKKVDIMNKMVTELSIYMHETELDRCMDFMYQIQDSKFDINPTVSDCKTQLKLILGSDRYEEIVSQWKQNNQKILSVFGTLKFKNKKDLTDKTLYDGLDPEDNPDDWEKIYV